MRNQSLRFAREWARSPLKTGAIFPSGRMLCQLMTSGIGPFTGRIIELGAGTGSITAQLIAKGVEPPNLTVVELNPSFAEHLRRRFPGVNVVNAPAQAIGALVPPGNDPAAGPIGAVISSLPFLSLPDDLVEQVLATSFDLMCPEGGAGGAFTFFTYGLQVPLSPQLLGRLRLNALCMGKAMLNFPPARVFTLRRI